MGRVQKSFAPKGKLFILISSLLLGLSVALFSIASANTILYQDSVIRILVTDALLKRLIAVAAVGFGSAIVTVFTFICTKPLNSNSVLRSLQILVAILLWITAELGLTYDTSTAINVGIVKQNYGRPGYDDVTKAWDTLEERFNCDTHRGLFLYRDNYPISSRLQSLAKNNQIPSFESMEVNYYCVDHPHMVSGNYSPIDTAAYQLRFTESVRRCEKFWSTTGPARSLYTNSTLSCAEAFRLYSGLNAKQAYDRCSGELCATKIPRRINFWFRAAAVLEFALLLLIIAFNWGDQVGAWEGNFRLGLPACISNKKHTLDLPMKI